MDNQIFKYRFGQTLILRQSIYAVGYTDALYDLKQTVCKYKWQFASTNQPGWNLLFNNTYAMNDISQFSSLISYFPAYDEVTELHCIFLE